MSYTYEFPHPAVTADICIFSIRDGRLNVLLIQRLIEPFKDSWAIPGGFIKMDEDLIEGAARELEEVGVAVDGAINPLIGDDAWAKGKDPPDEARLRRDRVRERPRCRHPLCVSLLQLIRGENTHPRAIPIVLREFQ